MKLVEVVGLIEVETKDGFIDYIDLKKVKSVNGALGIVCFRDGIVKDLKCSSIEKIRECMLQV